MLPGPAAPEACELIKECLPLSGKTKADWISWAAIVLNAVFTITAFWWTQRKEALQKHQCVHSLALEFDHVMHMMDSTIDQCERVFDMLLDGAGQLCTASQVNIFQRDARQSYESSAADLQLKSAIHVRKLRVHALSEGARRLKDEADTLCKITRSSDDRRHVQRMLECLATVTHIEVASSQDDAFYLSRLVTRDLAADLLRSGRRVLAICCRRLEVQPSILARVNLWRFFMGSDQRQLLEIWEKYSATDLSSSSGMSRGRTKRVGQIDAALMKPFAIKAFDASISTLPEAGEAEMTVFENPQCISDATVLGLKEVQARCSQEPLPNLKTPLDEIEFSV